MTNQTKTNEQGEELSPAVMGYLDNYVRESIDYRTCLVRVRDVILSPLEEAIASEHILNIHNQNTIRLKDIDEWAKVIPREELEELFLLASRDYKKGIFGKRVINPDINFGYKGYKVGREDAYFDTKNKEFVFANGKATPWGLYVANNEKAIAELKQGLTKVYEQIDTLKGKTFKNIAQVGEELRGMAPLKRSNLWAHPVIPNICRLAKEDFGLSTDVNLFNLWKINFAKILYDLILPDESTLTKEKMAEYYQQKSREALK